MTDPQLGDWAYIISLMYVCPLTHLLDIHEMPKDCPGESLLGFSELGHNL